MSYIRYVPSAQAGWRGNAIAAPQVATFNLTDAEIVAMSFRNVLRSAAGPDGRLIKKRLKRIARIRDYKRSWVDHVANKFWFSVADAAAYRHPRRRR